jgi:murein DD-endopeptidase MepM/ murein hydrolase activator NlpD
MKLLYIISTSIFFTSKIGANCVVAIPDDCMEGKVCAKFNSKGESKCFEVPKVSTVSFDLPFSKTSKVVCTQSGRFSSATHIYRNMLYAIDLATPYNEPSAVIHASAPGKVYAYSNCQNPTGKPEQTKTDDCGLGYGNHVRILHEDGYISLYAHLAAVYVKTGDTVRRQQKIGMEGATGQAGFRHLHWDVHKLEGSKDSWEAQLSNPGWGGYSVPFLFNVNINGKEKIVDSSKIACRWLDMSQPIWTGTYDAPKSI